MSPPSTRFLTIDSAGRIVLPGKVRRWLSLRAGSRLRIAVVANRLELIPETEADPAFATSPTKCAVLRPAGRPFDAAAATRTERDNQD